MVSVPLLSSPSFFSHPCNIKETPPIPVDIFNQFTNFRILEIIAIFLKF
jgi:hypothetical protein